MTDQDRAKRIKNWREKLPPMPLEAMHAECADLIARIAKFGLGVQANMPMLHLKAIVALLIGKGFCTQAEFDLAVATAQRDELAEKLAEAPKVRDAAEKERIRQMLALPPDGIPRITH